MEAKNMLKKESLLAIPDFTKPFHVYTDTSDKQIGATVVHDGKPLVSTPENWTLYKTTTLLEK